MLTTTNNSTLALEALDANDLKTRLEESAITGLLALDIDETLSLTGHYWFERMNVLFGAPGDESDVDQVIAQYKLCQNVPCWRDNPDAQAWMAEQRESNNMQINLPLIDNSNAISRRLHADIGIGCYLTVRPESVNAGTISWLRKHSFPEVPVVAKPSSVPFADGSKVWKGAVLGYLYPHISAIVDDNPTILQGLPDSYQGTVFLYGHADISQDIEQVIKDKNLKVIPCATWADVDVNVRDWASRNAN